MCDEIRSKAGESIKECVFNDKVTIVLEAEEIKISNVFQAIMLFYHIMRGHKIYGRVPYFVTDNVFHGNTDRPMLEIIDELKL